MNRIVIKSIGFVSALGNDEASALTNWNQEYQGITEKLPIKNNLNLRKTRRMNDIAKLLVSTVQSCLEQYESTNQLNHDDTGIIVNTAYGTMNSIVTYAQEISTDQPMLASPTLFANTVYNSVVGHAAVYYGLKGPSNLLMGSDSFFLTMHLLKKKSANNIIVSGVDEYCEQTYECLKSKYGAPVLCEGAASVLLSNEGVSDYGYICGSASSSIGCNPYLHVCGDVSSRFHSLIQQSLQNADVKAEDIDAVFMCSDRFSGLRISEDTAVDDIFGNAVIKEYIKDKTGDTLGANTALSMSLAAIRLKQHDYDKVLVLGNEVSGTIEAYVVSKE